MRVSSAPAAADQAAWLAPPAGELSRAILLYCAMLGWFVGEYMCLECVHLYTYDLFCEKVGFKLCWGCLVFYPFFYCIGVWPLVRAPPARDLCPMTAVVLGALFLSGWLLTRGANMQKFLFKRRVCVPRAS